VELIHLYYFYRPAEEIVGASGKKLYIFEHRDGQYLPTKEIL
jgi:hypothetical protein